MCVATHGLKGAQEEPLPHAKERESSHREVASNPQISSTLFRALGLRLLPVPLRPSLPSTMLLCITPGSTPFSRLCLIRLSSSALAAIASASGSLRFLASSLPGSPLLLARAGAVPAEVTYEVAQSSAAHLQLGR